MTAAKVLWCLSAAPSLLLLLSLLFVRVTAAGGTAVDPRLAPLEAPATPLIANDPYFQVDELSLL